MRINIEKKMKNIFCFVLQLMVISLSVVRAESGQKLCETNRRLCVTGLCPIEECLRCEHDAICNTTNPNEVVPRGLSLYTEYLDITYSGPDAQLTPDMFKGLSGLKDVQINGNIAAIAQNTFILQWDLKWLTISGGKLSLLPDQLFSKTQRLQQLSLPKNNFQTIPSNIFPQISNVTLVDFSHNPLDGCVNETINPGFANLTKLQELRLARYGKSVELCQNVSKNYLQPLEHIQVIDLSESLLFFGDQGILSTLKNLSSLAINNVSPYKECPAKAEELFHNMPPKLSHLTFRNWASTEYVNDSCIMSNVTLAGLKKLTKLLLFDCRYGDKIFGNVLTPEIFSGFAKIRIILLHWSGIALVESGAFNSIPHAAQIELTGNLLGPRQLELYTRDVPSKLTNLNLNSVGINIPTYNASSILLSFPKLKTLYMDDNVLERVPDFGFSQNISSVVTILTLNRNGISQFSTDGERLCKVMPKLKTLKMEANKLVDVTGVRFCSEIGNLDLADNLIGKNQRNNFEAIGQLHNLDHLDLSKNKIKYLTSEWFTNLKLIHTLILADNVISSLEDNAFGKLPSLSSLDLSSNVLPVFNESIVSNALLNVFALYLSDNQITTLSPKLLQIIDTRMTKLTYLGLVGNPLMCTCDSSLSNWVKKSNIILLVKYLNCSTPENTDVTTPVLNFKAKPFLCKVKTPLIVSGIVLLFVVLSLFIALPTYKYRWYLRHPQVTARAVAEKLKEVEFDQKCEYDAFISYDTRSDTDSQWVVDKLIPATENISGADSLNTQNLRLYVVDRDSAVGSPKYTEKCRAIEASRKVIILLTNSYLANPSCLSEADLVAGYEMVDGEHCYQPNRILVLILEELNEQAIRSPVTSLLTQNVIHIVDDEVKMKRIWRRVKRFITKPKYVYRKKRRTLAAPEPSVERVPTETDPLIQ